MHLGTSDHQLRVVSQAQWKSRRADEIAAHLGTNGSRVIDRSDEMSSPRAKHLKTRHSSEPGIPPKVPVAWICGRPGYSKSRKLQSERNGLMLLR